MADTTINMGLTVWTDPADPYSHVQLANNWSIIDGHNHADKGGTQIPTAGIEDKAITQPKIADQAVGTNQIENQSVTIPKLAPDVLGLVPLGSVIPWYRPNNAVDIPTTSGAFVLPIGQTLTASQHDFPGGGSIVLPDLRNRFILGAATSGTGTGSTTPPASGDRGGSQTHSHTISSSGSLITDTGGGHRHSHVNSIGEWRAFDVDSGITPDVIVDPSSYFMGGSGPGIPTIPDINYPPPYRQYDSYTTPVDIAVIGHHGWVLKHESNWYPNFVNDISLVRYLTVSSKNGDHSHQVPSHTHSIGTTDSRPNFVGLLYLMRVRNV